jgi:uncharacterized OB-fold protein
MSEAKVLPDTSLPLTAPFWAGLRMRRLMVQQCAACGARRYPAAPICEHCLTSGGDWVEIDASGTLWSYVVYHRGLARGFADEVPYTVGLVEVDGDLQVIAQIDAPRESLQVGMRVRARYTEVTETVTLLSWEPDMEGKADDA